MWNKDVEYTRVKLCWFDYLEAAYEACQLGTDMIGLHLFKDEDVEKKTSNFVDMLKVLPSSVEHTLLTDLTKNNLITVLEKMPINCIQLYPDWNPQDISELRNRVARPIRILKVMSAIPSENKIEDDRLFIEHYLGHVDAILLDSHRCGGTGKLADLNHCKHIIEASELPVMLAGGLTPDNVSDVIRNLKPFGVDVESGVSTKFHSEFMLKDIRKCQLFIRAVAEEDRLLLRKLAGFAVGK